MATSLFLIKSVLEFVSGEEDGDESESAEDNDDGDNEDETNDVEDNTNDVIEDSNDGENDANLTESHIYVENIVTEAYDANEGNVIEGNDASTVVNGASKERKWKRLTQRKTSKRKKRSKNG